MSDVARILGANVRAERVRRGWTQSDLGESLSLRKSAVSALERGARACDLADLIRICQAFAVPLATLCQGLDEHEIAALGL